MKNKPISARLNLAAKPLKQIEVNLIEAQTSSYLDFLANGIKEIFDEINPISDYTGESWELRFEELEWGKDNISMRDAQKLGLSYDRPLYVNAKLINKKTGEIKKQKIFVADIPVMSDRGSFVVNGNERVVVMQVVRAEGVLFVEAKSPGHTQTLFAVKLMPLRGKWFDFEVNKHGVMMIKLLDKRPKILLTTLLRALGHSGDNEIKALLADVNTGEIDFVERTLKKDSTTNSEEALLEIYRKLKPEDSLNVENAKEFIESIFFNKRRFYLGKIGRYQMNKKLGITSKITLEDYTLKPTDVVKIVRALIKLNNKTMPVDDIDSLANRRIRGVGELIGERIRVGVLRMEKNIRDRMSTYSSEELITPSLIVNTKPIIASINQFFGSSAVSRYMDQENILSELETKRRITAGGPRGLTKERATFSVRDVHSSHYAKLCPVETPEGPSIGIVSHMAVYARINEYGFLEAPYFRVLSNVKLAEVNKDLVAGTVLRENAVDAKGKTLVKKGAKLTKATIDMLLKAKVELIKVQPTVTDEVVYLQSDHEMTYKIGPANVETNKEAVITNDAVFVRTNGNYVKVPPTEIDFIDINPGEIAGLGLSLVPFSFNDDPTRTLMASNMQRQAVPLLKPMAPIVGTGYERVVGAASGRGVLAKHDGKVISSDANAITIRYDDKANTKEVIEIEKFVKTNQNTSFTQLPIVKVGDVFKKGDMLVDGPAMQNGELALGRNLLAAYMYYEGFNYEDGLIVSERLVKEDVLTSVHVKEYVQDVRETKLGDEQITRDIPNVGEYALRNLDENGVVRIGANVNSQDILVGIIAPKGETELTAEEKLLRAIFGEYARDVRDNSLRMPHGDQGIVIGVQLLDKNKGDKLNPGVLRQVKVWVARTQKISVGDKLTGLHGDKGVISKILPEEEMPYLEDGTPIDIILGPASMVKRMNLGQIREMETASMAEALGIRVEVPPFATLDLAKLEKLAKEKGVKHELKKTVYDGRTGKPYASKVLVGPRYFLKLNHLSSDKIHARSTGSYTLVTQQPLGGKAQFGGQRFGEMEVWALEAHAAVHNLQELLTIKSDDVIGRAAAYKAIIQGTQIEAPNIPESFKVLISELRALGLNLEMIEPDQDEVDEAEIVEGVLENEGTDLSPEVA